MSKLEAGGVDRIILYSQQEWAYDHFMYFELLVDYSDKNDIPLIVVVCTSEWVKPRHPTTPPRYRNVDLQHWGTYWLTDVANRLTKMKVNLTPSSDSFTYPFISMNSKPHAHRCLMMDMLSKHNVIERGAVSWLEYAYPGEIIKENMLPSVSRGYPYKHWSPYIKKLSEVLHTPSPTQGLNYYSVPLEYSQSFVQLIVESQTRNHIVSEKSWMPILYRKPFIIFSTQYHHALLQDYGILLYDEIFDYSFDQEPDEAIRAEEIVKQLVRICNLPPVAHQKMYKRVAAKLEYNFNLAEKLSKDPNGIPKIILDVYTADPSNKYCSASEVEYICVKY
jgi:hypothetical protein